MEKRQDIGQILMNAGLQLAPLISQEMTALLGRPIEYQPSGLGSAGPDGLSSSGHFKLIQKFGLQTQGLSLEPLTEDVFNALQSKLSEWSKGRFQLSPYRENAAVGHMHVYYCTTPVIETSFRRLDAPRLTPS